MTCARYFRPRGSRLKSPGNAYACMLLAFEADAATAWEKAKDLRRELWEDSSAAFQHLGDASPYTSTAEAFVRHNAHDCIYSDHEKDFRVLQLFARQFTKGRVLVVLHLSHRGG